MENKDILNMIEALDNANVPQENRLLWIDGEVYSEGEIPGDKADEILKEI